MPNITTCCNCFGNSVSVNNNCSTPTTSKCGDCFNLGHILVGCDNSIAPCDTTSTLKIPFDCFCIPCDAPQFKITNLKNIKGVTIESIDKTGITVRPDGTGDPRTPVRIEFFGACFDGCDTKSDFGSVSLYFKDLCKGVLCDEYYTCDKCTGNCLPIPPEVLMVPNNSKKEIIIK